MQYAFVCEQKMEWKDRMWADMLQPVVVAVNCFYNRNKLLCCFAMKPQIMLIMLIWKRLVREVRSKVFKLLLEYKPLQKLNIIRYFRFLLLEIEALQQIPTLRTVCVHKTAATYMYVTLHIGTCTPHHHPGNNAAAAGMMLKEQQKNTVWI